MAELIDKWDVVNKLIQLENNYNFYKDVWDAQTLYRRICELEIGIGKTPGLEVVHGRWITEKCDHVPWRIKNPEKWVIHKCSVCGYSNGRKHSNYCPNCGAKMDGERREGE